MFNKMQPNTDIELNSRRTNKVIKANILPDEKMKAIGFTDYNNAQWHFWKYLDNEISLDITIPKDRSDIDIVTLDENFLQPYDYQYILSKHHNFKFALGIKEKVEEWMTYLTKKGVIYGWVKGMYI